MFKRTLIITPHCDDETIGCGGLMSSLARDPKNFVRIVIVATHKDTYNYSAGRVVSNEERMSETLEAISVLGFNEENISVKQLSGFEDGKVDLASMKDLISQLDGEIRSFQPTAVLFPYSSHHQDHQAVYKASIAALRPTLDTRYIKLRAMYEYPYVNSWSSNLNPNSKLYYRLEVQDMLAKEEALKKFKSQLDRPDEDILSVDSIVALAITRGKEIGASYAEVFYPMSIIVDKEDLT